MNMYLHLTRKGIKYEDCHIPIQQTKTGEDHLRCIACLSKNKEVICVYPSLTAAAMAMKAKSLAAIGKAAREGRKSCGYYWKYL